MKKINLLAVLFTTLFIGCKSSILDDPTTVIQFSLPQKSYVKLTVENNYNTVIKVLIDNVEMEAGIHEISFDQNNLAEGIYYYTLEARGVENDSYYKTTKHILLVKP